MKLHTIDGKSFVQVNFQLDEIEPDTTNYKQRKPKFVSVDFLYVAVNIPIDKEHMANHTQWAEYLINNDGKPMPELILTPAGFEYAMQQLAFIPAQSQSAMGNYDVKDTDWNNDDVPWDDGGSTDPSSEEETAKVVEKTTPKPTATSWDDFEETESAPTAREEKADFEDNTEWEA